MGKFDVACKSFFSRSQNFADVINGAIFGGRMVINPVDLEDIGTERLFENGDKSYFVDVAKKWTVNGYNLLIIAIENQKHVDYAMVIRNMFTEALAYKKQVNEIREHHNNIHDLNDDEYLSKFAKKDMLTPIITVVIYFGEKAWDGPRTLYDMMDMDERLKPYIFNYKLNLIDYHDYENMEIFHDECKLVFDALATRDNKKLFEDYFAKNNHLHIQTANLVGQILNIDIKKKDILRTQEGDEANMCKALDEIKQDCISIGEKRGISIGKKKGISIGEIRERENNAINMIKLKLSVNTIMSCINISLDELKALSEKVGVALTY